MVRKFSTKPSLKLKTNLSAGRKDAYTEVFFWFEVEAKGVNLRSEPRRAQTQYSGEFNAGPEGSEQVRFWPDDTVARLFAAHAQFLRFLDNANTARKKLNSAVLQLLRHPLNVIEQEMATPDFLTFCTSVAVPLACEAPSDERMYALCRGSVWSCSRELKPEQWRILVDAYVAREEAELAQALGLLPQPEDREAIPTAVRRAVWARDNGRCARCGSRERLEYDHIIPISRGGNNAERNIELLCESCNRAKSDAII
jgi:hypothetical protein